MISEPILLKKHPKIEFQLLDHGFQLIDEQREENSGFYAYHDVESVELNKAWYPRLAKWLRIVTSICNFVPFYPDAETCKQANVIIHVKKDRLGMWLTDSNMASKAKMLKEALDKKTSTTLQKTLVVSESSY